MKFRLLSIFILAILAFSGFKTLSFLESKSSDSTKISSIPGSKVTGESTFGQFTNHVKIAEWDRENTFINYNLYRAQGVGYPLTTIDERNNNISLNPIKVLVIGDSFIWGDGVTDPAITFGMKLQDELNSLTSKGKFKVINYGKTGASTFNHVDYFTQAALSKIDPDVIMYAYYVNDVVPNFNEKIICGDKSVCDKFNPQSTPEYRSCINGDEGLVGALIKNLIRPNFPRLAGNLLVRHCDVTLKKMSKVTKSDEELWKNNKSNPWFPAWQKAIKIFAENTKKYPTYATELYFNLPETSNDQETLSEFKKNEIPIFTTNNSLKLIEEVGNAKLALNPVNSHANAWLNTTYVREIAPQLLTEMQKIQNLQKRLLTNEPFTTKYDLISSVLPYSTITSVNTANEAKLELPLFKDIDTFPHVIAGNPLPSQYVACMSIGYPHIEINLNRFIKGGELSINTLLENENLTLGYFYYDENYERIYVEVGDLSKNNKFKIPDKQYGLTLTLGNKRGNCELNKVISMKPFTVKIQHNQSID